MCLNFVGIDSYINVNLLFIKVQISPTHAHTHTLPGLITSPVDKGHYSKEAGACPWLQRSG